MENWSLGRMKTRVYVDGRRPLVLSVSGAGCSSHQLRSPVGHRVIDHGNLAVSDESEASGVAGRLVGHDDGVEELAPLGVESA